MDDALLRTFLDDIKANPFDDTPRLILADWLQEQGETDADRARGEYLRFQVGPLKRLEWTVPGFRERELWQAHGVAWTRSVQAYSKLHIREEGGLLSVLGKAEAFLARAVREMTATPAWDWVETVGLDGGDRRLPSVLHRPLVERVGRLRIEVEPELQALIIQGLRSSPYLERLHGVLFGHRALSREQLNQLADWSGLARLRELHLTVDGATCPIFARLPMPALRSLSLSVYGAQDGTLDVALRAPFLPEVVLLRVFCWGDHSLGAFGGKDGAPFRSLEVLDLVNSQIGNAGAALLAEVDFPALHSLRLRCCSIGEVGLRALARAPWLPNLESLDLSNNILEIGAEELLGAPLTGLRQLQLSESHLTDEGLAALTTSPHLQRLEALTLDVNRLGLAAGQLLAKSHFPALRILDLRRAWLAESSLHDLARWPGLARLELLDLSAHSDRDGSLAALLASPYYNPRTRITLAGVPLPANGR
jgi:uncharacterized protein (TIGR02996 family)